jgi:hypothetical protein
MSKKPKSKPAPVTPAVPPPRPAVPPRYGAREAQPLDSFTAQLDERLRSFTVFGDQPPPKVEQTQEDVDAVSAMSVLLDLPEFATLLEYVADKTVRQPKVLSASADPMKGWALAQRQEGQNDTFFLLVALIAAVREEPAPSRG